MGRLLILNLKGSMRLLSVRGFIMLALVALGVFVLVFNLWQEFNSDPCDQESDKFERQECEIDQLLN